jgi:predicted nucleic acid-binding protein
MAFVLDSSVTLAWLLPDEHQDDVDVLADSLVDTTAVVPAIWAYEVGNALRVARRRARITDADLNRLRRVLTLLPIEIEPVASDVVLGSVADLADKQDLTTYDAAYVELALRRGLPLATLDERLRKACANLRITSLPP